MLTFVCSSRLPVRSGSGLMMKRTKHTMEDIDDAPRSALLAALDKCEEGSSFDATQGKRFTRPCN